MRKLIVILFAVALLFVIAGGAWAQDLEDTPDKGKHKVEFSTFDDRQAVGFTIDGAEDGQVVFTEPKDIAGGPNPKNIQDFNDQEEIEADAIANRGDAYFGKVIADQADLLFSCMGDPADGATEQVCVYVEKSLANGGGGGFLWTHSDFVKDVPHFSGTELDALQLHGSASGWYGNRYSLQGDPAMPGDAGLPYSVRRHIRGTNIFDPGFVPKSDIVGAITFLGWSGVEESVDVDGLMVRDRGTRNEWDDGDTIMFSIRATGTWDGGEIVVLPFTGKPNSASFLIHDGHQWNTAFSVATTFGTGTEEVDALEAVSNIDMPAPIPALTNWGLLVLLVLLVISGIIVIRHRRRGVVRA